jgi:cell division protein FtsB
MRGLKQLQLLHEAHSSKQLDAIHALENRSLQQQTELKARQAAIDTLQEDKNRLETTVHQMQQMADLHRNECAQRDLLQQT